MLRTLSSALFFCLLVCSIGSVLSGCSPPNLREPSKEFKRQSEVSGEDKVSTEETAAVGDGGVPERAPGPTPLSSDQDCVPAQEICNNRDDDCDGKVDNLVAMAGESCTVNDPLSGCSKGSFRCEAGTLRCVSTQNQSKEVCDDLLDNNCNGVVDEGFGWTRAGGGFGLMKGTSIVVDTAGNHYVLGSFTGTVYVRDKEIVSKGKQDVYLARFSAAGELLWLQSFGGAEWESGGRLLLSKSGALFVIGETEGEFRWGSVTVKANGRSTFLIRVQTNGTPVWGKVLSSGLVTRVGGAAIDSSGNLWLGGHFQGVLTLGTKDLSATDQQQAFVA